LKEKQKQKTGQAPGGTTMALLAHEKKKKKT
jgi:hypothetical protein